MDSNQQIIDINQSGGTQTDPRYLKVRETAYLLENDLGKAEQEFTREAFAMLQNLQVKFLKKYGAQLNELEDLKDGIKAYQARGMKQFHRKVQQMYLSLTDDNNQVNQATMEQEVKKLHQQFVGQYQPQDNYQRLRDQQANRLRRAITEENLSEGGSPF